MPAETTVDVLNRVIVLHNIALPCYLVEAVPSVRSSADERAMTVIRDIAAAKHEIADKLALLVDDCGGVPDNGDFPLNFTAFNDLSIDYLVKRMIQRQEQEIVVIQSAIDAVSRAPMARALLEEALGAARGHLDMLRDLTAPAIAVAH